jgi:two-component system KDP operon response regulator KdpE/two-component system response regulator VicR
MPQEKPVQVRTPRNNEMKSKERILVLDSDNQTIEDISRAFDVCTNNSWELIRSSSTKQCLEMIKTDELKGVILGDTNKTNVIWLIRQIHQLSNLPLIVLSGIQDLPFELEALNTGADFVMNKPVRHMELVARIRAIRRHIEQCARRETHSRREVLVR